MNKIAFKGTKEGIYIKADENSDIDEIKGFLDTLSEKEIKVLEGGNIIGLKGNQPNFTDKIKLYNILTEKFKMNVKSLDPIVAIKPKQVTKEVIKHKEVIMQKEVRVNTKIVKTTVRSGSLIEHSSDIIIYGDVNPGAEIKSKGNITVLGTLKGIAHAGSDGELNAVIIALNLQATQLRIGSIITRAPDEGFEQPDSAEIAYVKDNQILIETI